MRTPTDVPVAGPQYFLRHGAYSAAIAGVGASLRALEFEGRALIHGYRADQVRPFYRGAVLVPWPNRVVDGQFYFNGQHHELALTEPARSHALHGLVAWATWELEDSSESSITLGHTIAPQTGYPFRLHVRTTYTLSDDGLTWQVEATNTGGGVAPYGAAPHPYLVAGHEPVDEWQILIPGERVLTVTPDRLIPTGLQDVSTFDGGSLDFRAARTVGDTFIDHAFTDLARGTEGTGAVDVRSPSGTGVRMTWDAASPWLQVHTPQAAGPDAWRSSLAVEPMTCPPDAFNSGTDLVRLAPGQTHSVRWGISTL